MDKLGIIFDLIFEARTVLVRWAIAHLKISLILKWQRHTTTGIAALLVGKVADKFSGFTLSWINKFLTTGARNCNNMLKHIGILTSSLKVLGRTCKVAINLCLQHRASPPNELLFSWRYYTGNPVVNTRF